MRRFACVVIALLLAAGTAHAGAWTLDQHQFAVFAGTTSSHAARRYGDSGIAAKPIVFNKLLFQDWMEYGLTDSVTLFAAPEYVLAQSNMNGSAATSTRSASFEAGLRVLLLTKIGELSVQASGKTAGAFDMSISSSGESGRQFETRLLYGRSFKLFHRDAFIDVEAAERWIARPRPDEFAFEGAAGLWLTRRNLLLAQSFNIMTRGAVLPPYEPYRLSKLQFSLVHRITRRWSFQSGYFISLAGRNIVKETGMVATIWFQT